MYVVIHECQENLSGDLLMAGVVETLPEKISPAQGACYERWLIRGGVYRRLLVQPDPGVGCHCHFLAFAWR